MTSAFGGIFHISITIALGGLLLLVGCTNNPAVGATRQTQSAVKDHGITTGIDEKTIYTQVNTDLKAGTCQLLCSAIETMFGDPMEVPGLSQKEVDQVVHDYGAKLVWYIHNGHEFVVGEQGGIDSSDQERKWKYAERYNRCLYKLLATSDADPAQQTSVIPYLQCVKKEADVVLSISMVLPGRKTARVDKVYLQRTKPGDEASYRAMSSLENGCGPNVSVATSVTPEVREKDVELTIRENTHSSDANSSIELKISAPYFADRKGEIGGITYEIKWTKIQNRPEDQPMSNPSKQHS